MRPILFCLLMMMLVPSGAGNSAISNPGERRRNEIKDYVEQALHRIPVDAAMRRVDKVLYAMITARVDSMEATLKLRQR